MTNTHWQHFILRFMAYIVRVFEIMNRKKRQVENVLIESASLIGAWGLHVLTVACVRRR